jgi:4,5-DOPA dioxygenase extradiol
LIHPLVSDRMERREFAKLSALTMLASPERMIKDLLLSDDQQLEMPVLFVGHGSPMNAIEKNKYSDSWTALGLKIQKPKAILTISAHWETDGTKLMANPFPETIHDFGGFPQALFDAQYKAPGDPKLAAETVQLLHDYEAKTDLSWGLDHGTWSVLKPMFPNADIPVIQLSLDYRKAPNRHYEMAKMLQTLRKKGVLILGSGNIVHNLGLLDWRNPDKAFDWATEFNTIVVNAIKQGNHQKLIHFNQLGKSAQLSIPSTEHYLPMLYVLAALKKDETVKFFNDTPSMGSLYMTSFVSG